jgi:hypothetical protein
MPDNPDKRRVFVSYSAEPIENVQFVARLADSLRKVGFEVSLHEWRSAGDSKPDSGSWDGRASARHGLIIVTRDWLEGTGPPAEIKLPANQLAGTDRRIAVRRDPIDERLLAARLPGLSSIEWFPDDPEPEARFWEVYCALTRTPAGDRPDWARSGRNLLGGWSQGSAGPAATAPESTSILECPSRPVLARSALAWTIVLTDAGKCFRVDRGEPLAIRPLPDLDGCSALAVDAAGTLVVGFYEGMVATPRDDEWAYQAAEAPVMSLASTARGLAIGDALGSIIFRDPGNQSTTKVVAGEPVVDMMAAQDEVVALGAKGGLWRATWTEAGAPSLSSVTPSEALGRPVGLFDTGSTSRVGVFSAERCALLVRGHRSATVGVRRFREGINTVVRFGSKTGSRDDPPLGILTDHGQLWIASADLRSVTAVVMPEESAEVVGLAPGTPGWLLAWSSAGAFVAVGQDRGVRVLDAPHVALAYAEPDLPGRVTAVCWQPERGVQVRRLGLEPVR